MGAEAPISVLVLARDEADALGRLLPRLAFAAERIVVWDPRGTRATREVAECCGARVCERAFDGFGAQRQFGLECCTQPVVLWIDADEWPDDALIASLRRLAGADAVPFVAEMRRATWFLGREIHHCGWADEWIARLFTREGARFDDALVHERLTFAGVPRRVRCEGRLEHHSYPTWQACVGKLTRYAEANTEQAWRGGRRASALDVVFRPPLRFLRMYVAQAGILDGTHGLLVCLLAATQVFLKYAGLMARARQTPAP